MSLSFTKTRKTWESSIFCISFWIFSFFLSFGKFFQVSTVEDPCPDHQSQIVDARGGVVSGLWNRCRGLPQPPANWWVEIYFSEIPLYLVFKRIQIFHGTAKTPLNSLFLPFIIYWDVNGTEKSQKDVLPNFVS